MDFESVAAFAIASFVVAVSPGPSWLIVIASTAHAGPKHGMLAVAGNAVGILCHGIIAATGIATVFTRSPEAMKVLQTIGACYLIVLGLQFLKSPRVPSVLPTDGGRGVGGFRAGLITNMLNPKVPLLLWALLPQVVSHDTAQGNASLIVYGMLHASIASIVLSVVVLSSHRAVRFGARPHHRTAARRVSGGILATLGVWLLLSP